MSVPPVARFCPHCNEALAGPVDARMEGEFLFVGRQAAFPMTHCLFCAGRDHVQPWSKNLLFVPPWLNAVALVACLCTRGIGLLVVFLIYFFVRKTCRLVLPRCGPCRDRQGTALIGGWLAAGGAVVVLPAACFSLGRASGVRDGEFFGILGGLLAALVLLLVIQYTWINRRTVGCVGIDDSRVRLRVPNPELTRDALVELERV